MTVKEWSRGRSRLPALLLSKPQNLEYDFFKPAYM
jgi:hypothetical protein